MTTSLNNREAQLAWARAGAYDGGIDGSIGPMSRRAMSALVPKFKGSEKRQVVAATQTSLVKTGYFPGAVDGYVGHLTRDAMDALLYFLAHGKNEVVERAPTRASTSAHLDLPRQVDMGRYYGDPMTQVPKRLVTIELPFKLRIDWNLRQRVSKIRVHEKAAPSLKAALLAVHEHYGMDRMRALGIDRYAGTYNKRKMRGGTKWSTHAYGCAIDFYASRNGLRTRCPQALFCGSDYKAFLDIMEDHGWLPAIRLWGADAMHFQRAKL